MADQDLIQQYNYDAFVPEKFERWMQFDHSPALGTKVPDFPLWQQSDRAETSLSAIYSAHRYTIVEFGSFT